MQFMNKELNPKAFHAGVKYTDRNSRHLYVLRKYPGAEIQLISVSSMNYEFNAKDKHIN